MNLLLGRTKMVLIIFAALAALMVSSALIELTQSKKEIIHIMSEQAHALLEAITIASQNTLRASEYLDILANEQGVQFDKADPVYRAFRKNTGFGVLLRNVVAHNPRIIYAALQDTTTILAASGNITVLEAVQESDFLYSAWHDSLFSTRTTVFDSSEIFEAVHPFTYHQRILGVLRLGLSLKPVEVVNQRLYRRLVVITIVLILIGLIIFTYLFIQQRYAILHRQYTVVETYSGNIIDNVSDGIIVVDDRGRVTIFNRSAEKLFNKSIENVSGKTLFYIFDNADYVKQIDTPGVLLPMEWILGNKKHYLLISKSEFLGDQGKPNTIFVIRDMTHEKQLEEQMQRKQRMTAMGELASGVAHEIRNPLNTISTIIQQLNKDFEPIEAVGEYHQLAELVYKEVNRINLTVQDFLRFSRPEPVHPQKIQLQKFLNEIQQQFAASLESGNIRMTISNQYKGQVSWDPGQMRQVFINLIQNAREAIVQSEGLISIQVKKTEADSLEIRIADSGEGISQEMRSNIFNLYFTTKAKGTGIGLSIVQRIIYEHRGIIQVESVLGKGTEFIIQLPMRI